MLNKLRKVNIATTIIVPKKVLSVDTGLFTEASGVKLDVRGLSVEYLVTVDRKKRIILKLYKVLSSPEEITIQRITSLDFTIPKSERQVLLAGKRFIQYLQERVIAGAIPYNEGENVEIGIIKSLWAKIINFLMGDHTKSMNDPHVDKLPKNPPFGEPQEIEADLGETKLYIRYVTEAGQNFVPDQPTGLSSVVGKAWVSPIKSAQIQGGVLTIELYKTLWDPTKEEKKALFKFPFSLNRGIIIIGDKKLENLEITDSIGILTIKTPIEEQELEEIAISLGGEWVPLEIVLTKKRLLNGY